MLGQMFDESHNINAIAASVESDNSESAAVTILFYLTFEHTLGRLTQTYMDDNADLMSRALHLCAQNFAIIKHRSDRNSDLISMTSMLRVLINLNLSERDITNIHTIYINIIYQAELCRINRADELDKISPMIDEYDIALKLPIKYEDGRDLLLELYNIQVPQQQQHQLHQQQQQNQKRYIVEPQYPDGTYGAEVAKIIYKSNFDKCAEILRKIDTTNTSAAEYYQQLARNFELQIAITTLTYFNSATIPSLMNIADLCAFMQNAIPIIDINFNCMFSRRSDRDIILILDSLKFDERKLTRKINVNTHHMYITIYDIHKCMYPRNAELQSANKTFLTKYGGNLSDIQ
jgi:hypothetical protein